MNTKLDEHTGKLTEDWDGRSLDEINREETSSNATANYGTFYVTENALGEFVTLTREELKNRLTDAALGQAPPCELPELIINPHDLPATGKGVGEADR